MDTKESLRAEARLRRDAMPADARRIASKAIAAAVPDLPEWRAAPGVLAYVSTGSEVDTALLIAACAASGVSVLLPAAVEDGALAWRMAAPANRMTPGRYGIPEPPGPNIAPPPGALVLVPGLAFDAAGCRLGYGAGYYDRFLSTHAGPKVGLCFDMQLAARLPAEAHDVAMDIVVTERRVCRPAGN